MRGTECPLPPAYLEAANAREFHRMAEFVHDTVVFNGETVSRDDYVAAMRHALQPTGRDVTFTEYAFYHFRVNRFEHMWYLVDVRAVEAQLTA